MGYGPLSGHGLDADGNGVIFVSYQLLVACKGGASGVPTPETSRLGQLVDWLRRGKGGASGLIALGRGSSHEKRGHGDASRLQVRALSAGAAARLSWSCGALCQCHRSHGAAPWLDG